MIPNQITFIGGGNMARSLISGLLANGVSPQQIRVVDPNDEQRQQIAHMNVATYANQSEAVAGSDVIVLAVKPQVMSQVAQDLTDFTQRTKPLIVSIAAGIRCDDLGRWLGGNVAIVRTMPNTPAMVQSGATGLFANTQVTAAQKGQAESIMRAVGITLWVNEETQLDAVTALSGSGPAYFFLMMEAMMAAGEKLGLDTKTSRLLTVQTAFGAAKMAIESKVDPATLRAQVTSPNGTTERAIKTFAQNNFETTVMNAMQAAQTRATELAQELGAQA